MYTTTDEWKQIYRLLKKMAFWFNFDPLCLLQLSGHCFSVIRGSNQYVGYIPVKSSKPYEVMHILYRGGQDGKGEAVG